ncbi:hypothetical protein [Seonamhaeicola sp.]|uniref:hypothetical protein n=1 Tax=Seonamhaeicola sp. TaxID=1912245 RepID=UPI00356A9156
METFTKYRKIETKNSLHKLYLNEFLNALERWVNVVNQFGKNSNEANVERVSAERQEWLFKQTCSFSGICTTSIKRELNLINY